VVSLITYVGVRYEPPRVHEPRRGSCPENGPIGGAIFPAFGRRSGSPRSAASPPRRPGARCSAEGSGGATGVMTAMKMPGQHVAGSDRTPPRNSAECEPGATPIRYGSIFDANIHLSVRSAHPVSRTSRSCIHGDLEAEGGRRLSCAPVRGSRPATVNVFCRIYTHGRENGQCEEVSCSPRPDFVSSRRPEAVRQLWRRDAWYRGIASVAL
jgi:hypothetical protein